MATLNVGAGQAYSTLAAAVAASKNGDTIAVQAGTYVNDFATINTKITIVGVGGVANFVATVDPPNGKGILVTRTDVTVQNLSFSGAAVPDLNGAGIRHEGGNLTVIDSYFHDNENGILATAGGTVRITGSEFANNGAGDGYSHNIYAGPIAALIIDDSYFHDADVGHQIKSRAQTTTITNSRIYDGSGTGSYSIDVPNGGVVVIRDNVIEQGPNSDNPVIIHYGGESAAYAGSSLTIADNVVVNDLSGGSARMLYNATTVTGTLTGNDVYGLTSGQITSGPATVSGTTYLSTRPTLDTSAPWLDGGSTEPLDIAVTISDTTPTQGYALAAGVTAEGGSLAGVSLAYQWQMQDGGNWTNISGATAASYTPGAAQAGHALRVTVSADGSAATASGATDVAGSFFSGGSGADAPVLTAGADSVLGGAGNDSLAGLAGADTLIGGDGADTLNGGAGADSMVGGTGNDLYIVDHAGDVVVEAANQGADTIQSSLATHTLSANVETLVTTRAEGATLTGNALGNMLIGAAGADVLNGMDGADTLDGQGGADTLRGGTGDDLYFVTGAEDTVVEAANAGTDTVVVTGGTSYTLSANTEYLVLAGTAVDGTGNDLNNIILGNAADNRLMGAGGADILVGGDGKDVLVGGAGGDVLIGGPGSDVFLYNQVSDSALAAPDWIQDFVAGEDRINLQAIDANTQLAGDQAFAWIGTGDFTGAAGQLRAASDGAGNWLVLGDVNGDRSADLAISVTSATAAGASWFIL